MKFERDSTKLKRNLAGKDSVAYKYAAAKAAKSVMSTGAARAIKQLMQLRQYQNVTFIYDAVL
jgi:hypothetical protein